MIFCKCLHLEILTERPTCKLRKVSILYAGSPYAIDIKTAKGPIYPVKVYGPGVDDGILPDFESHFMVDARGAGAGELHVSIMGPKGKDRECRIRRGLEIKIRTNRLNVAILGPKDYYWGC